MVAVFKKLLKRGVPLFIVKLLAYWYSNQNMCVQWGNSVSTKFQVTNGVKQGGVLSPKLFNVYTNDLSVILNNTHVGGKIGCRKLNHLFYADDVCLISLSSAGMQKLLDLCQNYAKSHDLLFNGKKTMCMNFSPTKICAFEPDLKLNGESIQYVKQAKYLGTIISCGNSDADVKRQMRRFYANANVLLRKFSKCSYDIKCMLFRSFCTNLYCSQFWYHSSQSILRKLKISYNNSLRRLLNLPKYNSASEMFVCLNIPSLGELQRKSINGFITRLKSTDNSIVNSLINSSLPLYSKIWSWWKSIVFI